MRKLTIEMMHKIAEDRNGKCLSENYIDSVTKLKWMCSEGHIWEAKPNSVTRGSWCAKCSNLRLVRYSIEDMQQIAEDRKGKCLSEKYINNITKLKWMCSEGHTWEATPGSIMSQGSWCRSCKGRDKLTIEEMHKIAEDRNGKCLSKKYINNRTKLKWMCSERHIWEATPRGVKKGNWCRTCQGLDKLTIEEMHKIAKDRNGKCLSKEYVNARKNLKWMCSEGHIWEATPGSVKRSSWCLKCQGFEKLTIEEMQQIAEDRNGKCLSKKYINSDTKLKWMCSEGHIWEATPTSIKHHLNWCKDCSMYRNLNEEICRTTFEQLFDKKFLKTKPAWLKNSTGYLLELDGYCPELNIAFEYQGEQHYQVGYYSKNKQQLEVLKTRDKLKENLCNAQGVQLFLIKYDQNLLKLSSYIKEQLTVKGLNSTKINFNKEIDFNRIFFHRKIIREMQRIAEDRDGKCLSEKYINSKTKLKWMCSEGHIWEAKPENVKSGTWCRKCLGLNKQTIEEMQQIAEDRNGKCLSKEYVNANTKLKWMCSEGHIWETTPTSITTQGTWCRACKGLNKLTIEEMQKIAEDRNGKCLSKKYVNAKNKLKWMCSEGHIWETTPDTVKGGSWCRKCLGLNKQTIEEMQRIAEDRNGKCLSKEYFNANTKLKWMCSEGHIWETTPDTVKGGSWCRKCLGLNKQTIEEMQRIAEDRNGKCLSKEYFNANTKLKWMCSEGHIWEAKPSNVKLGTWCKICSIK